MRGFKLKLAVCGILPVFDYFLTVSRKDDPNKIGFIGGKVDEGETIENAVVREFLEETGLSVEINHDYKPFISEDNNGYMVHCYVVKLIDEEHLQTSEYETGVVRLANKIQLTKSSPWNEYNAAAFNWFNF